MASEVKTNKVSPATGVALSIGDSGDTITVPSGATLDISASTLTPPATMPASSGVNLTALNATNLGSGTVPTARLGSGTASSSTFLTGAQTYAAAGGDLTPVWQMSMAGATQASMTSQVWYDINFDAADIDTDSGCDTTAKTYTIPAGKGGKYMVGVRVFTGNNSGGYGYTLLNDSEIRLRKNPAGADTILMSVWADWRNNPVRRGPLGGCIMLDLTAGDVLYVEVRNHIVTAGNYGVVIAADGGNVFYGFKLLGV